MNRKIFTLIFIIIFSQLKNLSSQTVQATIIKSDANCVTIFAQPSLAISDPLSNIVFSISVPDQDPNNNPSTTTTFAVTNMKIDDSNPAPYVSNGRYYIDFNIVQDGQPPSLAWDANSQNEIATICFGSNNNTAEPVQLNSLSDYGQNGYTTWYFELQGSGDITDSAPFYSTATSNATNSTNSFVQTSETVNLPIKLQSFSASKYNNAASLLNWVSSSEVNASHIEVERSDDAILWDKIGTVEAKGNYNTTSYYKFIDEALPLSRGSNNEFYYRLKLVDNDGSTDYSEIRSVNFDHGHITDLSIYPNPAVDRVNVEMSTTNYDSPTTKLHIFDMTGKLVMKQDISTNGISPVDISTLSMAVYTFKVNYDNKEINKKIVKTE